MSVRGVFASKAVLLLWIAAIALSPLTLAGKAHAASISSGNLALNKSVSAQYTCCSESPAETVDGVFSYVNVPHNRWTDWGQNTSTNWLAIDFGASTTFNQVKLYIYNDNGGVMPPASYVIQYGEMVNNEITWTNVNGQTNDPVTPVEQLNTANFDTVTARYVRAFLTHGAAAVGLTEIEVYYDLAFAVMEQIDRLPASNAVTLADQATISAARTAYDGLTATQQSMVTNVSKLTADEAEIALLLYQDVTVQSAMSNLAGDTITLRLASGTVLDATYGMQANKFQLAVNGTQVAVTNAVYDAADTSLQTIKLTLASADLQYATAAALSVQSGAFKLNNQAYNKAIPSVAVTTAVYAVISQIDQLPAADAVTLSDQTVVAAARSAYNNLSAVQQSLVTNVNKLVAAEGAIATLQMTFENVALQSAFGNAAGNTVTIRLASVLDTTYGMQASNFLLSVNGTQVAVTNVVYDATDPGKHTIKLTLASADLQNATSAAIVIQKGALKLSDGSFNNATASFPVILFSKLDHNSDNRIGIDDVAQIVTNPSLRFDVNQDGSFSLTDIESILGQLSTGPILQ
jgi:cell division protein FtsB